MVKECSDQGKGSVPNMEAGCCLGSERNKVSMGGGGEGRPRPPERGKDKQLMPSKGGAGTTWRRTRKNNLIGRDGGGSARTDLAAI